jgi:hypothetical protein
LIHHQYLAFQPLQPDPNHHVRVAFHGRLMAKISALRRFLWLARMAELLELAGVAGRGMGMEKQDCRVGSGMKGRNVHEEL